MMSTKITSRLVVGDLRERVEAVLGEDDLEARLHEEDLRAAPDRVAVVDDQHLDRPCVRL